MQAGAPSAVFDTTPDAPDAFLFVAPREGLARDAAAFRIGGVFDADGAVAPDGARVAWSFGDGATSADAAPVHRYQKAGVYEAEATITLADGRTLAAKKTVAIETPVAVLANFDGGFADRSDIANPVSASSGVTLAADRWGDAARLPGGSETIKIGRSAELIGHDDYTIMLDFQKDDAAGGGRLVYFTKSFILTVGADSLRADVTTDVKSGAITAKTSALKSTDWQHAALTFSGDDGVATLYLNGDVVGALSGLDGARQTGSTSHDLHLGGPFGGGFAGLVDNFTFLRGALSAEQIRDVYEAERAQDAAQLMDAIPLDLPPQEFDGLW